MKKINPIMLVIIVLVIGFLAFKDDKELAEKRREAGAVVESAVMIPISDEHLTNYPDAYTNH